MDVEIYAGDSKDLIITVVDQDGKPVPLFGATIKWELAQSGTAALTKTVGSGITLSDSNNGIFTVSVTKADTTALSGTYQHAARVTTSDGRSALILSGNFTVTKGLI